MNTNKPAQASRFRWPTKEEIEVDRTHFEGELIDLKSQLVWRVHPENNGETMTWSQAIAHAWQESKEGVPLWRLPTVEELSSLLQVVAQETRLAIYDQERNTEPATLKKGEVMRADGFLQWDQNWYWTSSPVVDGESHAWVVGFGYGGVYHGAHGNDGLVRLVRAGGVSV